jgi:hypothetical protein
VDDLMSVSGEVAWESSKPSLTGVCGLVPTELSPRAPVENREVRPVGIVTRFEPDGRVGLRLVQGVLDQVVQDRVEITGRRRALGFDGVGDQAQPAQGAGL